MKKWIFLDIDGVLSTNTEFMKIIKSPLDVTGNYPISISLMDKNRASDIETYLRTYFLLIQKINLLVIGL